MANDERLLDLAWARYQRDGEALDGALALPAWLECNTTAHPLMICLADSPRVIELDFSARATRLGAHDLAEAGASEAIQLLLSEYGACAALGRYAEDRDCYAGEQVDHNKALYRDAPVEKHDDGAEHKQGRCVGQQMGPAGMDQRREENAPEAERFPRENTIHA